MHVDTGEGCEYIFARDAFAESHPPSPNSAYLTWIEAGRWKF